MRQLTRHGLALTALLALYGCAYTPAQRHDTPSSAAFEMTPAVLQKGRIFMRPTQPVTLEGDAGAPLLDPTSWVDIKNVRVVLHANNRTLEELMADVLTQVRPYTGPWQVQWRLKKDNLDLLQEPFSLNTETTFGELVGYLSDFMVNYRGIHLKFEMFNAERILVITDNG